MNIIQLNKGVEYKEKLQSTGFTSTTGTPLLLSLLSVVFLSNTLIYLFKKDYFTSLTPANILALTMGILLMQSAVLGNGTNKYTIKWMSGYLKMMIPLIGIGGMYAIYYFVGYYYETQNTLPDIFLMLFNLSCSVIILYYLISFNVSIKAIVTILEIAFLVLVATVFIDIIYPATFSELDTRPAGLPGNPNVTAFRMVILLSMLMVSHISSYKKLIYIVAGSAAIFLTFSRGGMVLLFILIVYLIINNIRQLKKFNFFILIPVTMIAISILVVIGSKDPKLLSNLVKNDYTEKRLSMFSSVNTVVDVEDSRVFLASLYFDKAADKPIVGSGALATKTEKVNIEGPHNMYLLMWFELGIGGLILYLLFLYNLFRAAMRLNSFFLFIWCISLIVSSLFSHTLITDYFFLFLSPLIYYYASFNKDLLNSVE